MNQNYGWWYNKNINPKQDLYFDLNMFNEESLYPVTNNIRANIKILKSEFSFEEFKKFINGNLEKHHRNIKDYIEYISNKNESVICTYQNEIFDNINLLKEKNIKNIIFFYTGFIDRSKIENQASGVDIVFVKINPCKDFLEACHSSDADFLINVCCSDKEINLQFNIEKNSQIIAMYNNKYHSRLLYFFTSSHRRSNPDDFYELLKADLYGDKIIKIFIEKLKDNSYINHDAYIFCHKTNQYRHHEDEKIWLSSYYKNTIFLDAFEKKINKDNFLKDCVQGKKL